MSGSWKSVWQYSQLAHLSCFSGTIIRITIAQMTKYNKRGGHLSGRGVFTDGTVRVDLLGTPHEQLFAVEQVCFSPETQLKLYESGAKVSRLFNKNPAWSLDVVHNIHQLISQCWFGFHFLISFYKTTRYRLRLQNSFFLIRGKFTRHTAMAATANSHSRTFRPGKCPV